MAVLGNSAPVIDRVTVSPAQPKTNDTIVATATAHDADNNALTYAYHWTRNGVDIPDVTGASLDLSIAGNGDRGDAIAVRVTVSDGMLTSAPVTSASVVIMDSGPAATVALNTTTPTTHAALVASVAASDADGDALTFTYIWRVNGVTRQTTITTAVSDSFDLGQPGNGNKGDIVTVELTPSDGTVSGATATASATIVAGRAR